MTADKDFKRLVRQRAKQTGRSYASVRQVLRRKQRRQLMATTEENYESMALIRDVISTFLTPIAEENSRPLWGLMTAVMFDKKDGDWIVYLYSLSPGLVIGRRGVTATALREALRDAMGESGLQMDVVDFGKHHAAVVEARAERLHEGTRRSQ